MNRQQAWAEDVELQGQVMIPPRPLTPHKGRGAVSNLQGRYEVHRREGFDDGWTVPGLKEEGKPAPKTIVTDEFAKTILSRNASPDIPFNVSINPYRGCEHEMST